MTTPSPEIARSIVAAGIRTNYHDVGEGFPLLLIHGSGPGVSAWANWRTVMPELARRSRVIAPDIVGFGFTERPAGQQYNMDVWLEQAVGLLDALGLEQTDLVGNSFGGALAMAIAIRHPRRVRRLNRRSRRCRARWLRTSAARSPRRWPPGALFTAWK